MKYVQLLLECMTSISFEVRFEESHFGCVFFDTFVALNAGATVLGDGKVFIHIAALKNLLLVSSFSGRAHVYDQ